MIPRAVNPDCENATFTSARGCCAVVVVIAETDVINERTRVFIVILNAVTFVIQADVRSAVRAIPVKFRTDIEVDTAAATLRE